MSTCNVCIGGYDGSVDFFFERQVTCRKPAKCAECGQPIISGMKYFRVGGKCEGEMWTMKVCVMCQEIGKVFSCGEGREYGNMWELMTDYAFPKLTTASPCFRELSPAAKEFVLKRWREWKGL